MFGEMLPSLLIGGSRGAPGMHPGPKFHAVFGKIWQNRMLAAPRIGVPSCMESWIRPCEILINYSSFS